VRAMLDTSVLIGTIPTAVIDGIDEYGASFIVRAELLRGRERFARTAGHEHAARVRTQLVEALDAIPGFWTPFDDAAADAYATLAARPETAVRSKDALIAAQAVARGVPLLTADRGFTRFIGLDVEFI